MKKNHIVYIFSGFVLTVLLFANSVSADHSWGEYHWARTANPFSLNLGDAVSNSWDTSLNLASSDWSISSVLNTSVVSSKTNPRVCKPTNGRAEICNSRYGNNGWLGIAQIWVTGGQHITQGIVKLNDTYFNTKTYNTPQWRNFVMCQEIGHVLGLDHQDEDFYNANLGTCMDYTNSPASNQHPNQHDYDQLEAIYSHLDPTSTVKNAISSSRARNLSVTERAEWGKEIKTDKKGKASIYRRDVGNNEKIFTFVIWADPSLLEAPE